MRVARLKSVFSRAVFEEIRSVSSQTETRKRQYCQKKRRKQETENALPDALFLRLRFSFLRAVFLVFILRSHNRTLIELFKHAVSVSFAANARIIRQVIDAPANASPVFLLHLGILNGVFARNFTKPVEPRACKLLLFADFDEIAVSGLPFGSVFKGNEREIHLHMIDFCAVQRGMNELELTHRLDLAFIHADIFRDLCARQSIIPMNRGCIAHDFFVRQTAQAYVCPYVSEIIAQKLIAS